MTGNDIVRRPKIEALERFAVKSYTVAQVAALTGAQAGEIVYVSDEAGGAVLAFYDGTNWRRVTDRAIVS